MLSFAVWTVWLVLAILLATQVWILTNRELAVPGWVLDRFAERLAASQLQAKFGDTYFDPSGRVLIKDTSIFTPSFAEPLATVHLLYFQLDPWSLLAGRFEPRELRASGVNFFVPAMLSATGRAEPIVRDLEISVLPDENDLVLQQLTARIGNLEVTARGRIHVGTWQHRQGAPMPIADFVAREYPRLSRQAATYINRLAAFEEPRLQLELTSSETRSAIANVTFLTRSFRLDQPFAAQAVNLVARARFPIAGDYSIRSQLDLWADELRLPHATVVQGVRARMRGTLQPAKRSFEPEQVDLQLGQVSSDGQEASSLSAHLEWPKEALLGSIFTRLADAPLAVNGEVDLTQKTAGLHLATTATPALIDTLSHWSHRDLSALLQLQSKPDITADIKLGAGWKLEMIDARLVTGPLIARKVPLESVTGRVRLTGDDFQATDIVLRQGENIARGSYTMNTATRDFRFLLEGRLRPEGINGWFQDWWPHFFSHFDFRAAAPDADVDIQGRWGEVRPTTVFIRVTAASPVVKTVPFDHVHTVLFIRPHFHEARELFATRGEGFARGTFAREMNPPTSALRQLTFAVTTTLDVQESARIFGPAGLSIVEPFRFSAPPRLRIQGEVLGPASPKGEHQTVHIEGESLGAFQLFAFPLSNLTFTADLRDDDLVVQRADAVFAGGAATGHVRLWGRGARRQVGFDYTLKNAKLGPAIITVENFAALRNKAAIPTKSAFLEKVADVHMDLAVSAIGKYDDPFSFQGEGNADLTGAELGEVRLLGLLSELLNFTSLRFTALRTNFKLEGPRLVFPELKLTGANSVIDAKGSYALDRKELNFNAKVFPFGESRFIPQAVMGAILSPLSQVLEVKLTGNLAKPSWAFMLGPTNFFRNLLSPRYSPPTKPVPSPAPEKILSPYLQR